MKSILQFILTIAILAMLFLCISVRAQTVTVTNTVPGYAVGSNAPSFTLAGLFSEGVWAGIQHGAKDAIYFVENTTNNGVLQIEVGALYAESTHDVGGFLDAYMPVGGTNSVFGAGFGLAYLDQNFYDATLNARLGDTYRLPFIRVPIFAFVESGMGWNLSKNEAMAQAFAGGLLKIPITQTQTFTLGAAVGTISDYPGNILAAGASYTFSF